MPEENNNVNNNQQQYTNANIDYYEARQSDINSLRDQLVNLERVLGGISTAAIENEIDNIEASISNLANMVENRAPSSEIESGIMNVEAQIVSLISRLDELSQGDPNTGYGDLSIIIIIIQFLLITISYIIQAIFEIVDVNIPLVGVGLILLPFAWLRDLLNWLAYLGTTIIDIVLYFIDNINPSSGILKTIENVLLPINTIIESLINVLHLVSLDLVDILTQFAVVLLNAIGRIF